MIPEIGHFLLWLALGVALILGVMPLIGAQRNNPGWMALARPSAYLLFALVVAAFICLIVSFVRHDFSVLNVASNSNSALPLAYLQAVAHQQPFAGNGLWAWLVFAALGVRSLLCLRVGDSGFARAAQFVWWLLWPFAVSLLLVHLTRQRRSRVA